MKNETTARSNMITIRGSIQNLSGSLAPYEASQGSALAINPNAGTYAVQMLKTPPQEGQVLSSAIPALKGYPVAFGAFSSIAGVKTLVCTARNANKLAAVAEVKDILAGWLRPQGATEIGFCTRRSTRAFYEAENSGLQSLFIANQHATFARLGMREKGVVDVIAAAGKKVYFETVEGTKAQLSTLRWDEVFTSASGIRSLSNYGGGIIAVNLAGPGGGSLINLGRGYNPGGQAKVVGEFTPATAEALVAYAKRNSPTSGFFVTVKNGGKMHLTSFNVAPETFRKAAVLDTKNGLGLTV